MRVDGGAERSDTRSNVFEQSEWDDAFVRGTGPSAEIILTRALGELWARSDDTAAGSREREFALFELAPIPLFEMDPGGHIDAANPSAQRLLGVPSDGAALRSLGLELEACERLLQVARAARTHGRAVIRLDHLGRSHHVEALGRVQSERVLLSLIDSEHVFAEGEAERSARALRAILRAAREGVALLSRERLVYANEAWHKLAAPAAHGSILDEVVEGKSLAARLFELASEASDQTVDIRLGEGTSHEVLAELTAVLVDYQGQRCVLVMARDLTTRRRLEARVARSERLASLGMLVAGVAHEINNPLTYMLGNLESLSTRLEGHGAALTRDDGREAIREAIDGCRRIATLIRELRSFYRADDHDVVLLDPNQVIRDAVRRVASKCATAARLEMELADVPRVSGIQTSLVQVLINLIVNAVDAMPERSPEANLVRISSGSRGNDVRIEVADNGRGIPPADISRVFEPFFSRGKSSGSGLGLTISRNLVEQLNGWIDVDSRLGSGTRFIVHLEAAEQGPSARTSEPPALPAGLLSGTRVLVVDDEPLLARSVARLLAQAQEVVCAHSVASALDVLGLRDDIDVVVSDWVMPDGGAQALLRHMAHRGQQNLPVVVMAGLGQLGASDRIEGPCVRKPVSQGALLHAIAEALALPGRTSMVVRSDPRQSSEFPAVDAGSSQAGFGRRFGR